jgi:hypothetical protein
MSKVEYYNQYLILEVSALCEECVKIYQKEWYYSVWLAFIDARFVRFCNKPSIPPTIYFQKLPLTEEVKCCKVSLTRQLAASVHTSNTRYCK